MGQSGPYPLCILEEMLTCAASVSFQVLSAGKEAILALEIPHSHLSMLCVVTHRQVVSITHHEHGKKRISFPDLIFDLFCHFVLSFFRTIVLLKI